MSRGSEGPCRTLPENVTEIFSPKSAEEIRQKPSLGLRTLRLATGTGTLKSSFHFHIRARELLRRSYRRPVYSGCARVAS
eukprot:3170469-Pyramimonas_sp.AAC.1